MDTTFATVCSLLPYDLVESKPGIYPNEYTIHKAPKGGFALTIIPNDAYYLINPDLLSDAKEVRQIKVPVNSLELAQSIIMDYSVAVLGIAPPDSAPGLFALRGDWTDKKDFQIKHGALIGFHTKTQNKWFENLVAIADDIWAKTKSPLSISDLQRSACDILGLKREWLNAAPYEELEKCPVCKGIINPGALKCVHCGHIINKVELDKLLVTK